MEGPHVVSSEGREVSGGKKGEHHRFAHRARALAIGPLGSAQPVVASSRRYLFGWPILYAIAIISTSSCLGLCFSSSPPKEQNQKQILVSSLMRTRSLFLSLDSNIVAWTLAWFLSRLGSGLGLVLRFLAWVLCFDLISTPIFLLDLSRLLLDVRSLLSCTAPLCACHPVPGLHGRDTRLSPLLFSVRLTRRCSRLSTSLLLLTTHIASRG